MAMNGDVMEQRRGYCKPKMERVTLVPRESVLAACKGDTSTSGIGNPPSSCAAPTSCLADGTS